MYCINCGAEVKAYIYPDTGEEFACDCQNTIGEKFNSGFWKEEGWDDE
ncbi:MAG: hypothetical protein WC516_05990 [Patescibacteria group bacterium]|jgi:hypothetical protein